MYIAFNTEGVQLLIKLSEEYEAVKEEVSIIDFIDQKEEIYNEDCRLEYYQMFIDLIKHDKFFQSLSSKFSKKSSENRKISIILYLLLFRMRPSELHGNLISLQTTLGEKFVTAMICFICKPSLVDAARACAEKFYDCFYVQENITTPLISWQPFFREMLRSYKQYCREMKKHRIKPTTVPIEMNVLKRPTKPLKVAPSVSVSLPTICEKPTIVVTPGKVNRRNLKIISKNNKKNAEKLLAEVNNLQTGYMNTDKSYKYIETINKISNEQAEQFRKVKANSINNNPDVNLPIKRTVSTILQLKSTILKEQEKEIEWMDAICKGAFDSSIVEALENKDRIRKAKDHILSIEKRHLEGLLTREEAIEAKNVVTQKNKEKYKEFLKERTEWEKRLDEWKMKEQKRIHDVLENSRSIDEAAIEAKENLRIKNRKVVQDLKVSTKAILEAAMKEKQQELEKKIKMIRHMKVLEQIAKVTIQGKHFDFTDVQGFGFLNEMSLMELKERLAIIKIDIKEELEKRKKEISESRENAKKPILEAQSIVEEYEVDKIKNKEFLQRNNEIILDKIRRSIEAESGELVILRNKLERKRSQRLLGRDLFSSQLKV